MLPPEFVPEPIPKYIHDLLAEPLIYVRRQWREAQVTLLSLAQCVHRRQLATDKA